MNCQDEVNRKRSYYQGLEDSIAKAFGEDFLQTMEEIFNDESVSESTKATLRFWIDTVGPFSNALGYIANNRFLLEEKASIVAEDDGTPVMQADEIFTTLHRLNPYTIRDFLSVLMVESPIAERLLEVCLSDDRQGFVDAIKAAGCDLTPLSRLCSHCWDDQRSGIEIGADEDAFLYLLDGLADVEAVDEEEKSFQKAIKQLYPSAELLQDEGGSDFERNLEQYFEDYQTLCENIFENYIRYYIRWRDDFKERERQLLDPYLEHPFAEYVLEHLEHEYEGDEESFALSDDYFDLANIWPDNHEYFYVKEEVIDEGSETLTAFINYLALHGYIRNDNAVKELLAYRLTGYGRPEGELTPIVWSGKNGKSYELIYIVRHIAERGDYRKMRRFFTGPEWVKDRDSSYALAANTEFRRALEGFYPKVFPFEKQASQI